MNKTNIEWVKNPDGTQGYTWNPITGCLNGCEYCYASKLANTRLKDRYLANGNVAPYPPESELLLATSLVNPFYPRFWEDRLLDIPFTKKPIGVFVCDMSDLFGIGIPEWWTEQVFKSIAMYPDNRFYLLTKQPQNLIKFSPFPDNCWVGVSVTNNQMYREAIVALAHIEAKVKYISFEPLLENVKEHCFGSWVNWVIIGSQTKPYNPPKIEWVKEIVEACDKAGIPVFLKNNLALVMNDGKWKEGEYRKQIELRREMPK